MTKVRLTYAVRDALRNLRRNPSITIAAVLTAAVSLALVGSAFLLRQGVASATERWQGGVEFIVFADPAASGRQLIDLRDDLRDDPRVRQVVYVDQDEAYEEFSEMFADQPAVLEVVTPDQLPASFKVVPVEADSQIVGAIAADFEQRPGVYDVVVALDVVRTVEGLSDGLSTGVLVIASVLGAAAVALILNAIRMAVDARRREVEVMGLIGAPRWYIRLPFVLEGVVTGAAGGGVAIGAMTVAGRFLDRLGAGSSAQILAGFDVPTSAKLTISLMVLAAGIVVGAAGSLIAVSRHLRR